MTAQPSLDFRSTAPAAAPPDRAFGFAPAVERSTAPASAPAVMIERARAFANSTASATRVAYMLLPLALSSYRRMNAGGGGFVPKTAAGPAGIRQPGDKKNFRTGPAANAI
jgi:hypothetical protein